jgi:hypothetical protein
LIWVRLPSAIFRQLSIRPTADRTGKTQVKDSLDDPAFSEMITFSADVAE